MSERVADDLGLFVDLLRHVMAVIALIDQKRGRDNARIETHHRLQDQGGADLGLDRRMRTGEHQAQPLVRNVAFRLTLGFELVRHAAFGFEYGADLGNIGVLALFALITWRLAVRWMEKRLID